ncbi:xanthine dehydrogenase/oxidase-like [Suricata suricatta]|uniref:xanthine dehydrogenase/oxidase-like n=1 Tax=Suricata suricatta TaxID=37032 RepID=UPI001155AFC4|nr:xanthine dehydrogenase/oxidase-like [Suricata suricatta]
MTADELVFFVNGKKVVEKNADPETTLLAYLRRKLGLSGTKLGCGEGGCGACTVMLSKYDRFQNKIVHFSANACLAPICSLHHVAVTTVEGIGSTKSRLHPVQERIAKSHGSQCGFCTPGIVMSMYTLLRNQPEPTMEEIEDAFQGTGLGAQPRRWNGSWGFAEVREGPEWKPGMGQEVEALPYAGKAQVPQHGGYGLLGGALGSLPIVILECCCFSSSPRAPTYPGEGPEPLEDGPVACAATQVSCIEMKFKNKLFPMIVCPAWIPELNSVEHGPEGTRRTVRMDHTFFPAYRKTLLAPEEILLSIEIPYSREGEYFSAFKQASRREDDIAKVTSGMRVLFNPGTVQVKELALCYGGMADRTISALKTTWRQISHFWNEGLLQDVCAGLAEELSLAPDAPGGMVEFRRTLTLSFFFKFYLTVLQKLGKENSEDQCGKLDPTHASATLLFQKDPPANVQLFQEVPKGQSEEDMVGRSLPHLAAAMQASGEAVYCDDIPRYENELSLRLVTSTRAHAKIKSIDTSEAQKVPGFVCFISADDVPGSNITGICNDEMVFAKDEVTCVGHIIGAVVTDTREHAQRAAQAVKITYEDLPAIITIEDAIKNDSFYEPELKIEKGNLTKGFSEADNIVSGELHIGGQEHFYLETGGALIHVYTDGSVLLTHGGTEMGQGLHTKMVQVASRALKIPTSKIYISETSTNTVPNTSPTAASVSADLNGQAVYEACQTILKRLEPFKKKNPSGSWEDWVMAAYLDAVSLSATGFYKTPNLGYSFETNSGNAFHYFSYGVACSEVEIDCLTGDHKVRSVQNLKASVLGVVEAEWPWSLFALQVEGAFVQGLGLFTLEELHYSPEGSLHTRGPSTYKIPAFGSIPSVFRVSLLRDCPNKKAIYASKAVGEPPLFLAASIFFAIKDAIRAARAGNTDHKMKKLFQLDSPATPEKIRNACVDKFTTLCITGTTENCKPWSVRV